MIAQGLKSSFQNSLLSGSYNLLLGSGISLDSKNQHGKFLRSTEDLRRDLCRITGAKDSTNLQSVYALLSPQHKEQELIAEFSNCIPGPSLKYLPNYLWQRLFTFNIDDVIETLYERTGFAKQKIIPVNFDSAFEATPSRDELLSIHLHGWVRAPEIGFVFSASEYVRVMRNLNSWMHLLSGILPTEPFIIAGTSLNEIDLEYYLNHRTPETPRKGRGPSLLIEPNPDAVTRLYCKRYGLELITATFGEFLDWLKQEIPNPPSLADISIPIVPKLLTEAKSQKQLLSFFNDFEIVSATELPSSAVPSPFQYGREPDWKDIQQHYDIERKDSEIILNYARNIMKSAEPIPYRILLILDDSGTGKTTLIKRVAYNLARMGTPVFYVRTSSRINVNVAAEVLSSISRECIIIVDGLADHIEQIIDLVEKTTNTNRVYVIAAERRYRYEHIKLFIDSVFCKIITLEKMNNIENRRLIEQYRQYGLIGNQAAIDNPSLFTEHIAPHPIAISICLILNDFKPMESIIDSLWRESQEWDRNIYLSVSLAQYCYRVGLRYHLLQSLSGPHKTINKVIDRNIPLQLTTNPNDDNFVIALNSVISERILLKISKEDIATLREIFVSLAMSLAPYVNRNAIKSRTSEARLARRLFDADKIVKPLLGKSEAEAFYIAVKKNWEWNSRYWEQRALLIYEDDIKTAIQYARHAVSIERHPFPLTTLGKLLLRIMDSSRRNCSEIYNESYEFLTEAIEWESINSRISIHPYSTLLMGTIRYLELGGELNERQREKVDIYAENARRRYSRDPVIMNYLSKLDYLLK
jgi:hypothetical protein